jgi:hypothetical protein
MSQWRSGGRLQAATVDLLEGLVPRGLPRYGKPPFMDIPGCWGQGCSPAAFRSEATVQAYPQSKKAGQPFFPGGEPKPCDDESVKMERRLKAVRLTDDFSGTNEARGRARWSPPRSVEHGNRRGHGVRPGQAAVRLSVRLDSGRRGDPLVHHGPEEEDRRPVIEPGKHLGRQP